MSGNPLFLREQDLERTLELLLLGWKFVGLEELGGEAPLAGHEVQALHLVDRHPGLTLADLALLLQTPKQSLSRHLRRLVELGLLAQEPPAADRRTRPLRLTEPGRQRLASASAAAKRRLRRAFLAAGPGAVAGFERVLEALQDGPARRLLARPGTGTGTIGDLS